jgi:hypothetical protein
MNPSSSRMITGALDSWPDNITTRGKLAQGAAGCLQRAASSQ